MQAVIAGSDVGYGDIGYDVDESRAVGRWTTSSAAF